jgi:hypothetical protein
LTLDDENAINVGPSQAQWSRHNERSLLDLNVGIGYLRDAKSRQSFSGSTTGSVLIGDSVAVGGNLGLSRPWSEGLINVIYRMRNAPITLSGSAALAIGKQAYDFGDQTLRAKLSQASYLVGASYIPTDSTGRFQSLDLKAWGARAQQRGRSLAAPHTVAYETDTDFIIDNLSYRLAMGRLWGANIGSQFAVTDNWVARLSTGAERIAYHFANATTTHQTSPYHSLETWYQWNLEHPVVLGVSYKRGSAERSYAASVQDQMIRLTLFKRFGVGGTRGDTGMMINFIIPLDRSASRTWSTRLAERMRPVNAASGNAAILQLAAVRPLELPQVFLAKVDKTADTRFVIPKACVGTGVTVHDDVISAPVGAGAHIDSATKNGSPFAYQSLLSIAGDQLLIHVTRADPPHGQDTYRVLLSDAEGAAYEATFAVVAGRVEKCDVVSP